MKNEPLDELINQSIPLAYFRHHKHCRTFT